MPEQFHFHRNDPTVTVALAATDIQQITIWQNQTSDFQFEFHTQHEAGRPCYLREPDGPNRNLPKMNLEDGAWTGQLLQAASVRSQQNSQHFKHVVTNNLAASRKMAQRFYEGVEVVRNAAPPWFVKFTCTQDAKAKPVFVSRIV